MKHILLFSFLFSIVLLSGCDNESMDIDAERNTGIAPLISDVNPSLFIDGSLESSSVKFVVSDKDNISFDKAYVVVSLKSDTIDIKSQRIKIKEIKELPDTVTITATEAITAVGKTIANTSTTDYFVFEIVTENNGRTFYSNAVLAVRVLCPFDDELAKGDFSSSADKWESGNITIETDSEDPYKVYVYGLAELEGVEGNGEPLVMIINPLSFTVEAEKVIVAESAFGYDNLAFEGKGMFNSCEGVFTMRLEATVAQGSFGGINFTFTKK